MNTDSNNCRRSFLKKCAALTVGATVVGSGMKLSANPTDDWRWVGYCGLICDNTCNYFKNGQCPSCKSISYNCTVQKCAKAKQVPTCAHCSELDTCDDPFWVTNPTRYRKIKELRDSLIVTGIETREGNENDIRIFPNPAHDYLKIQNPQNHFCNFELVSINGQILKKGAIENTEHTLDISDMKPGNYLFKLVRNNNVLQIQHLVKL